LANVGIEVRQDLVSNDENAVIWADILAEAFEEVLKDEKIYAVA